MAWKELLLLLEGQTVHLPTPKNIYARDICINRDTPIFATGKAEVKYIGKLNTIDDIEMKFLLRLGYACYFITTTHDRSK